MTTNEETPEERAERIERELDATRVKTTVSKKEQAAIDAAAAERDAAAEADA